MIHYLDASAILRSALDAPGKIDFGSEPREFYSSRLASVECKRTLERLVEDQSLEAYVVKLRELFEAIELVAINESILKSAEPNTSLRIPYQFSAKG